MDQYIAGAGACSSSPFMMVAGGGGTTDVAGGALFVVLTLCPDMLDRLSDFRYIELNSVNDVVADAADDDDGVGGGATVRKGAICGRAACVKKKERERERER